MMKSPASRTGNLIRYAIFLVLVLLTSWFKNMAITKTSISGVFTLLFFCIAALTLTFFVRQFNLEKRYFAHPLNHLSDVFENCFGFFLVMVLAVGGLNLLIAWLQAQNQMPEFSHLITRFEFKDGGFWLYLLIAGIITPIIQQYLVAGFFNNYFFRAETPLNIVLAVLISGALYAVLQFQPFFMPAFIQMSLGWLFALSYLRTHNLAVPIFLNIFSTILVIVLA
ncbi:CPBP family intramembrane glutamic endopeptidase [Lapidilactobacillus wuchangensis]|uniref:CPBP family intramembrane glutamic endopeptidase n=1 Tax=Lapidilactobacillus wuchangensis TaxID=2486001 RepID=UPI000F7A0FA3|nr:CPBP family intramembrane glutamic endopeptidase [Lapidilactobacillus wuchangensis]